METISLQKKGKQVYPFSIEDSLKLSKFKDNQILVAKVSGTTKERSLIQLRLFFGVCRAVIENEPDDGWTHVDQVKNYVKVKLDFVDMQKTIVVGRKIIPHYRSISFAELKFIEANNFFDRAFELLAKYMGVSVEELLRNAE